MPEFGKPQPIIYKEKVPRKDIDIVDIGATEFGTPEQLKMYGLKPPTYEPEPKITESREFVQGQISDIALESQKQRNAMIKEYKDFFLTKTELGQNKKWVEKIPTMHLNQLQDLHTKYQEYEAQKQQQRITQVGEQLGLSTDMIGQIQSVYSPEEVPAKMQLAGIYKTLLGTKHASATMVKQFGELLSPTPEEEPSTYEQLGEQLRYKELTTGEEPTPTTKLPFELTSELDSTIRDFGARVVEGMEKGITSAEQMDANELLNEVMINYYGNSKDEAIREEAKQMINYTLRNMGMGTINWEMLE